MLPLLRRIIAATALATLTFFASTAGAVEPNFEVSAKQAILIDAKTGEVLYAKAADELMPPASMSKLMTVYTMFEALANGEYDLYDTFEVSEKAWRMGGSKMFVEVRKRVSIEDLLRGIIVSSGNDACIVIAEGLGGTEEHFAATMTERAREIGMEQSTFKNSTGWPDPDHMMTPAELAHLAKLIINNFPQYYGYFAEREFTYGIDITTGKPIVQPNRNLILGSVSGADGLKTGHTEASGYGLTASAERDDMRLILVVNGLTSERARARESERFLEWGFRTFKTYRLLSKGQPVEQALVWLGETARVPLVVAEDVIMTLPKRVRRNLKATLVYESPIKAPIELGDPLGKLVLTASNMEAIEVPLIAGGTSEKVSTFGKLGATFEYLLFGTSGE